MATEKGGSASAAAVRVALHAQQGRGGRTLLASEVVLKQFPGTLEFLLGTGSVAPSDDIRVSAHVRSARGCAADLHNHTPDSADYCELDTTADNIVKSALDAGLDVFAVTDHVSCASAGEVIAAAVRSDLRAGRGLLAIPGCELTVTYGRDEAHIVALFDQERHMARFKALIGLLDVGVRAVPFAQLPTFPFEHDPVGVCRAIDALGGVACVAHTDRWFGRIASSALRCFGGLRPRRRCQR